MKLPISWLKEYVDLTITVPELVDKLTLAGLEVISVKLVGVPMPEGLKCKIDEPGPVWAKDKIVTAKVLEITKVPETDKLKFLKLDLGKEFFLLFKDRAGDLGESLFFITVGRDEKFDVLHEPIRQAGLFRVLVTANVIGRQAETQSDKSLAQTFRRTR